MQERSRVHDGWYVGKGTSISGYMKSETVPVQRFPPNIKLPVGLMLLYSKVMSFGNIVILHRLDRSTSCAVVESCNRCLPMCAGSRAVQSVKMMTNPSQGFRHFSTVKIVPRRVGWDVGTKTRTSTQNRLCQGHIPTPRRFRRCEPKIHND